LTPPAANGRSILVSGRVTGKQGIGAFRSAAASLNA
jgi:hypothetical protein